MLECVKTLCSYVCRLLDRSGVDTKHEVVVPITNLDLAAPRIGFIVALALAKHTRQVRDSRLADALRELRCTRRICEEPNDSRNRFVITARRGGRLVGTPCLFRNGDAWHLLELTLTGVGTISRNR